MKQSEISHGSACYAHPILVTLDAAQFGDAASANQLLRAHLLERHGSGGGTANLHKLAGQIGWELPEVVEFFKDVTAEAASSPVLEGLLEPERYREHYFDSTYVPAVAPVCRLPEALAPPAPLVSWLVPVRNADGFVLDCLESIEAQKGMRAGNYEVILINDASDDRSLAILQQFAADRSHVRIIENEAHLGVAGSLIAGWTHCQGDFVARLDADDLAEPDRLEKQLRYMEQHPTISVLGGRTRSFWTEERRCTVESVKEKSNGHLSATVWREFHGNQTSRRREQISLSEINGDVAVVDGPAEYHGCRITHVGGEPLCLNKGEWRQALRSAQGQVSEVLLQRCDFLEGPRGSAALHPVVVRASLIFEEAIAGATALFRRADFPAGCPLPHEEAEHHWAWLAMEPRLHAANIADAVVRSRRHEGNREQREHAGIYESQCAAVRQHLKDVHCLKVDMHDAAALLHFRGPRTADQGGKLNRVLEQVERSYFDELVRPRDAQGRGEFWSDFVEGRETALEQALAAIRARFRDVVSSNSEVITSVPEHESRERRSRTPPR